MDVEFIIRQLLNGVTLAAILTLIALGLSVIYGLMGILNMAHGEFFVLGAYSTVWIVDLGGPFWASLIVAPMLMAGLGLLVYELLVKRLQVNPTATLLVTWGLSIVIRQALQLAVGAAPRTVAEPITGSLGIAGFEYPAYRLFVIGSGIVVVASIVWLFFRTDAGLQLRAAMMSRETAATLGIRTGRINALAFALGCALAGFAGALLSPLLPIEPSTGLDFLIDSFFVVLVGGAGSIAGTAAGGLVIGGGQSAIELVTTPALSSILVLCLAVAIISLRPRGLAFRR